MVGRKLSRIALILAAATTASCTPLPDTSPYTAATVQVRTSAAAAGSALHDEFGRMTDRLPEDKQARAAEISAAFDDAWKKTMGSLDGLTAYAESIEQITKAGNSGGASARAVAQSVQTLAGAVGIVPGAALAGVAADTFATIYSQIANIRAQRSLSRSLDAADPLIRDMANAITGQVTTARKSFEDVIALERQALNFSVNVDDVRSLDARLATAENNAARTLATLLENDAPEAQRLAAEVRLKRIRDGRAAIAPRMTAYHAELTALAVRAQAGRDLFAATDRAVTDWREAHRRMALAIRERRPFSVQSLVASAQEIQGLVERWRKL